MKIIRYTQDTVNKSVLRCVECEECRKKIDTYDIYTITLATNKNNGKGLLLCGNCARELKMELGIKVK